MFLADFLVPTALLKTRSPLLFLVVKTATLLGSIAMLSRDLPGATNCFSWLFTDLRTSLFFLDAVFFMNHFVRALTVEEGGGSGAAAPAGAADG